MENNHVTAAADTVKFADGSEYLLSPLNDKDYEELNLYVRAAFIRNVRDSFIEEELGSDIYRIDMALAQQQAISLQWTSGVGAAFMATPYNLARMLWQAIRKNHPNVTLDELRTHLFDPANITEARRAFDAVNNEASPNFLQGAKAPKKQGRGKGRLSRNRGRVRR